MGKVHTKRQQIYKHNDRRTFSEPLCNVRDKSRKELVNIANDWFLKFTSSITELSSKYLINAYQPSFFI